MSGLIKWFLQKFLGDSESMQAAILNLLAGLNIENNRVLKLIVGSVRAIVSDAELWQEIYDLVMGLVSDADSNKLGGVDVDDPVISEAIDKIWASPAATEMLLGAISSDDEAYRESRADAIGEEVGIDPVTIFAIISAAVQLFRWIRERRQNK
jgi:hypothetical protein